MRNGRMRETVSSRRNGDPCGDPLSSLPTTTTTRRPSTNTGTPLYARHITTNTETKPSPVGASLVAALPRHPLPTAW